MAPPEDLDDDPPGGTSQGEVQLSLPASTGNLRVVRLVAASLAADLEFGVDEIEDVRVAVDELAAALLHAGGDLEGSRLDLTFTTTGGVLGVEGSVATPPGGDGGPEVHEVAAELLGLLTDEYEVGADGGRSWFRLRRGHRVDAATDG